MDEEKISLKSRFVSIFEKLKSGKKIQYIAIVLIVVIVILSLFMNLSENLGVEKKVESSEVEFYVNDLEKRLISTLSKVSGVGEVSVVITVESGMETVLATKKTTKETTEGVFTEETPIIINGKTVIIKETYPKITGVLIVAKGANNFSVMARIQQAVVSLLNIELNQIEILTMK